jgi:hypothetical protein
MVVYNSRKRWEKAVCSSSNRDRAGACSAFQEI